MTELELMMDADNSADLDTYRARYLDLLTMERVHCECGEEALQVGDGSIVSCPSCRVPIGKLVSVKVTIPGRGVA